MSGTMLSRRLERLEQGLGTTAPLWIQRWLGAPLSDADQACAAAEWDERQRAPQRNAASFPPDLGRWLLERDQA